LSDAADDAIARPANVASLSALGLSALGIVFGDIGTSLRSLRCWFAVDSSLGERVSCELVSEIPNSLLAGKYREFRCAGKTGKE